MIRRVIVAEERHQMKRMDRVQGWLSRVEAVETKADELMRDSSQEIEKLCLRGFYSKNCKSSHKYGIEAAITIRAVAITIRAVETLMGEESFEVVAERLPAAAVEEINCEPTIVGMESTFEKVWRCLEEESVGIIGLYGMGGAGKTTLLTQINNKFLDSPNNFDVVIWVVVSQDVQPEKIQGKIGNKIGLFDESWKNRTFEEKALDIYKSLSKRKFVLLLDDIWERVDLIKVGVPLPSTKIISKIVFTTRSIDVCGLMEAHKNIRVFKR